MNRSVVFFMLVVGIDTVGLGIIIPVMPALLQRLGSVDVASAAAIGGALSFAYAFTQFICAPIVGALSDAYGRRVVLLSALAAFALDYAVMAFAPALWVLAIGRIVSGLTGATYSAANAALADITKPEDRAKTFGLIGLSFGIGFIVGPMLGGVAGIFGTRAPFLVAAGLAAANFAYGFFCAPETLAPELRRPFSLAYANPVASFVRAAKHTEIRGILIVLLLWQFAFQALPNTWSYFATAAFGWKAAAIGASLAFSGVMMAVAQGVLVGPLVKRFGERSSAMIGLVCGAVAYAVYALAHVGWITYVGMAIWSIGTLVSPACNAMMSRRIGADRQGELQGLVGSTYSLSAIFAPIAMTQIFAHVGPSAPWIVSALLAATAIPLVARAQTTNAAVLA